jgi:hypothetical protein
VSGPSALVAVAISALCEAGQTFYEGQPMFTSFIEVLLKDKGAPVVTPVKEWAPHRVPRALQKAAFRVRRQRKTGITSGEDAEEQP